MTRTSDTQPTSLLDVVNRLKPEPTALDAQWSASTRGSITATPTASRGTSRSSRRLVWVAGAAAALTLTGGAAWAVGMVPPFVSDIFGDVNSDEWGATEPVLIADLTLPNGTRFAVWRSDAADGGRCEAVAQDWDGKTDPLALSAGCSMEPETTAELTSYSPPFVSSQADEGPDPTAVVPIVYGQVDATKVHTVTVTTETQTLTLDVDPDTGGFAARLPQQTAHVTVRYLADTGEVVDTERLEDR